MIPFLPVIPRPSPHAWIQLARQLFVVAKENQIKCAAQDWRLPGGAKDHLHLSPEGWRATAVYQEEPPQTGRQPDQTRPRPKDAARGFGVSGGATSPAVAPAGARRSPQPRNEHRARGVPNTDAWRQPLRHPHPPDLKARTWPPHQQRGPSFITQGCSRNKSRQSPAGTKLRGRKFSRWMLQMHPS
jgi:hypothetical protein